VDTNYSVLCSTRSKRTLLAQNSLAQCKISPNDTITLHSNVEHTSNINACLTPSRRCRENSSL